MILQRLMQRRGRAASGGPPVWRLSPAPESSLPLLPLAPPAAPEGIELQALLLRLSPERGTAPDLLSAHTLIGRLGEPLEGPLGPHGEYRVSFIPRRAPRGARVVLCGFRFAPAAGTAEVHSGGDPAAAPAGAREARPAPAGFDVEIDLETPRRIDPPMEPEEGGALILQISGSLAARPGGGQ